MEPLLQLHFSKQLLPLAGSPLTALALQPILQAWHKRVMEALKLEAAEGVPAFSTASAAESFQEGAVFAAVVLRLLVDRLLAGDSFAEVEEEEQGEASGEGKKPLLFRLEPSIEVLKALTYAVRGLRDSCRVSKKLRWPAFAAPPLPSLQAANQTAQEWLWQASGVCDSLLLVLQEQRFMQPEADDEALVELLGDSLASDTAAGTSSAAEQELMAAALAEAQGLGMGAAAVTTAGAAGSISSLSAPAASKAAAQRPAPGSGWAAAAKSACTAAWQCLHNSVAGCPANQQLCWLMAVVLPVSSGSKSSALAQALVASRRAPAYAGYVAGMLYSCCCPPADSEHATVAGKMGEDKTAAIVAAPVAARWKSRLGHLVSSRQAFLPLLGLLVGGASSSSADGSVQAEGNSTSAELESAREWLRFTLAAAVQHLPLVAGDRVTGDRDSGKETPHVCGIHSVPPAPLSKGEELCSSGLCRMANTALHGVSPFAMLWGQSVGQQAGTATAAAAGAGIAEGGAAESKAGEEIRFEEAGEAASTPIPAPTSLQVPWTAELLVLLYLLEEVLQEGLLNDATSADAGDGWEEGVEEDAASSRKSKCSLLRKDSHLAQWAAALLLKALQDHDFLMQIQQQKEKQKESGSSSSSGSADGCDFGSSSAGQDLLVLTAGLHLLSAIIQALASLLSDCFTEQEQQLRREEEGEREGSEAVTAAAPSSPSLSSSSSSLDLTQLLAGPLFRTLHTVTARESKAAADKIPAGAKKQPSAAALPLSQDAATLLPAVVRLLALLSFKSTAAAEAALQQTGSIYSLLNQCQLRREAPLLREWALFAVRNLCESHEGVRQAISVLKAEQVQVAPELAALGVKVDATGRVHREKKSGAQEKKESGGSSGAAAGGAGARAAGASAAPTAAATEQKKLSELQLGEKEHLGL